VKERQRWALISLAFIGVLWAWGQLSPASPVGEPLRVSALQGGFSNAHYQAAEADPQLSREIIATYEALLKRAEREGAELAIWAESAVRAPLLTTPALQRRLTPAHEGAPAVIGGLAHTDPDGRRFNLAVSFAKGELLGRYAKVKTVPGVEAGFTPGDAWRPVPTEWGPVGVLICFESIYPHAGRALAQAGARLMVVLSNDAGFGETPISHHMTNRAIVRAVESGRWLVRVGQAGVSALISPSGEVKARLGLFEAGALTGEVHLLDAPTPYTRWGLWWLWLVGLGLVWGVQKEGAVTFYNTRASGTR
jgi:apolipoprotein N-acyltransferase